MTISMRTRPSSALTGFAFVVTLAILPFAAVPSFAWGSTMGTADSANALSTVNTQIPNTAAMDAVASASAERSTAKSTAASTQTTAGSTSTASRTSTESTAKSSSTQKAATGAIASSSAPVADGTYVIRSDVASTKVVDVAGGSKKNKANVQTATCTMAKSQKWRLSYHADTATYTLLNEKSKRALTVSKRPAKSGTNVYAATLKNSAAQQWNLVADDNGYRLISALDPTLSLDVAGSSKKNGANISICTSAASKGQRFYFLSTNPTVPSTRTIADGCYTIAASQSSDQKLDVAYADLNAGANVQLYENNNTAGQKFWISYNSDGYYSITSILSGKALEVAYANVVPTSNVRMWTSNGSAAQRWAIAVNADGTCTFTNKATGLAIDLAKSALTDGTNVFGYTADGRASQSFALTAADPITTGITSIRYARKSGKSFDVPGATRKAGTALTISAYNGSLAQKCLVKKVASATSSNPSYTLQIIGTGRYLASANGKLVQSSSATAHSSQWLIQWTGKGFSLVNEADGKAATLSSAKAKNGSGIVTDAYSGAKTQKFLLAYAQIIDPGCYTFTSALGSRCINVDDNGTRTGTNVNSVGANGNNAQKYLISKVGTHYKITSVLSRKALTVSGANVIIKKDRNAGSQLWSVGVGAAGNLMFTNVKYGKALGVEGNSKTSGANVGVYSTDAGAKGQRWRITPTAPVSGGIRCADGTWIWCDSTGYANRSAAISQLLSIAHSLLGVPYVWLGRYPQDGGMDCASFTWHCYHQLGIDIGFETLYQRNDGIEVSMDQLRPGDLILMYWGEGNYPHHVVLYAGNGMIYEEPDFGKHCQYVPLSSKNTNRFLVRRILR